MTTLSQASDYEGKYGMTFYDLSLTFLQNIFEKMSKQGPMRLEPASMNFTSKCANRSAMRNFTKCNRKNCHVIAKKSMEN